MYVAAGGCRRLRATTDRGYLRLILQESTRNLTFAGSARDLFETTEDQRKHILKLLESSHDREKIEGMKRLIAVRHRGCASDRASC